MPEPSAINYSRFIEILNRLDDDVDCRLNEAQFKQLLAEYPISKEKHFESVTFRGLKDRKTGTVSFNDIRVLYEAAITAPKSKAMLLILFRGVSSRRDRRVSLNEFKEIAILSKQNTDANSIESIFEQLDSTNSGKVTYPQVAHSLFNINVRPNENPYKEILQIRSPHTGCCRIL